MKVLKVTHKTSTDCLDNSYVFLDINVLHEGRAITLIIEGEIWAKYHNHYGDNVTPSYKELISTHAVVTTLHIYDYDANELSMTSELNTESKEIEELLKLYCYEN
jgi:acetolactate synthase small subunit